MLIFSFVSQALAQSQRRADGKYAENMTEPTKRIDPFQTGQDIGYGAFRFVAAPRG